MNNSSTNQQQFDNNTATKTVNNFQFTPSVFMRSNNSIKMNNMNTLDIPKQPRDEAALREKTLSTLKDAQRVISNNNNNNKPVMLSSFDTITAQTRMLCKASYACITFVYPDRQVIKSVSSDNIVQQEQQCGIPPLTKESSMETPRQHALCAHTILEKDGLLIVPDTTMDARFQTNPFTLGQYMGGVKVRFYAGTALIMPSGERLGALCVLDSQPRPHGLTEREQQWLKERASTIVSMLVNRKEQLKQQKQPLQQLQTQPVCTPQKQEEDKINKCLKRGAEALLSRSEIFAELMHDTTDDDCSSVTSSATHFTSTSSIVAPPPSATVAFVAVQPPTTTQAAAVALPSSAAAPISTVITQPSRIETADLPDYKKSGVDPDKYLVQLTETIWGAKPKVKAALDLGGYFPTISEDQMAAYNVEVVTICRNNNVEQLKEFFRENGREAMDCFNRFGEGLLNMACRRGFKEIVEFLLSEEVALSVRIRDDYGRTPMHDACWNPEPQLEICQRIMAQDPSLFLVADKRGYTPFQYARKSDWLVWRKFLFENKEKLEALARPDVTAVFS